MFWCSMEINKSGAKALKFNQQLNEIKFIEIQDFYDGKAVKLSADEATLDSDLSEGIIRTVSLLLDNTVKIQTEEVRLKAGEISSAKEISKA